MPRVPLLPLTAVTLVAGCTPQENPPGRLPGGYGARCPEAVCQEGLICSRDGFCRQPGDTGAVQQGRPCAATAQCAPGLVCGTAASCEPDRGGGAGDDCALADPCRPDLLCAGDGVCRTPGEPGTGNTGDECESDVDCRADRACAPEGICVNRDGPGEGEDCREGPGPCRSDLVCAGDGICRTPGEPGTAGDGEGCTATGDCRRPLVCSVDGRCVDGSQGAAEGEPCGLPDPAGPGPCQPTLVCASDMTCKEPGQPGTGGGGEDCVEQERCQFGFFCIFGRCARPVPWTGADCSAEAPTDPPVAYFRVPRGDEPLPEFYRLPFPNDVRRKGGRIDLSGHAEPSAVLPDGTVLRYLDGLQAREGFGLQQAIYFRFSTVVKTDSLYNVEGEPRRMSLVDVDPESPTRGDTVAARWAYRSGRTKYMCKNWAALTPLPHRVLAPNRTYAAIVTRRVQPKHEPEYARDADFEAVLADPVPADPDLARAHAAYAPLRDWLALPETLSRDDVLVATVFTTGDPARPMPRFREAVRARPAPESDDMVRCGSGQPSPCGPEAPSDGRGCPGEADSAFHELHGTYVTPRFQAGTPPFLTPEDGGEIAYDVDGVPVVQAEDPVCFAMTVPKGGAMPEEGWPVVLYMHGTGGSYRGFVDNGVAADLAEVALAEGDPVRFAVVGIDQAQHGPRRHSTESPERLFFNLLNPAAGKDNALQGAADLFSLARFVEGFSRTGDGSPTGQAIRFDPGRIYFVGHSQGAITSALALPFEPLVRGTVLSGAGGGTLISLLDKDNPVDLSVAAQVLLAETELDRFNPVLNLLQWYLDPADPAVYARYYLYTPPEGRTPAHLLQTLGMGDTYTPPAAIGYLAKVMGLHVAAPVLDESFKLREQEMPVSANKWVEAAGSRVTAVHRQVRPDGYDGHYVLFQHDDLRRRYRHFLATAASTGVATLVE